MSSLRQLIFSVRNSNSHGRGNRAIGYTDRQIAFWIKEGRNYLITEEVKRIGHVPIGYEQDMGCQTLVAVDQADCTAYNWGVDVKKIVIPKVLDLPENEGLTFFGLIDKRTRIFVSPFSYGELNDFMPFKPVRDFEGAMIGNTIYVTGIKQDNLCAVNIRGVFEDPTQVCSCTTAGDTICYDEDNDTYPMPANLEGMLMRWIDDTYILRKAQLPQDVLNNEHKETVV